MIQNPQVLRRWQKAVEGPLHGYLSGQYPAEMATYDRFREVSGSSCNFCKAAARLMFKREAVANKNFIGNFKANNWAGY